MGIRYWSLGLILTPASAILLDPDDHLARGDDDGYGDDDDDDGDDDDDVDELW